MAAFQFPDPAVQTTVKNPITGSTYQWQDPPGKWVVTVSIRDVGDIVWEGDKKPDPNPGDYKLWYHTEELELYFYYCDENNRCDWIPTSKPITMLEDLDNTVYELRRDLTAVNVAVRENENQIGRTIYFGDTAPTIYPDEVIDGATYPNELNYKFWYDDSRLELLILFRDADGDDSYVPVSIPLESLTDANVSQETFSYTTGRLLTAIEENYVHNLKQDESIDELNELIKGKVLKYTFDNNTGTLVTTPGKISSNSGFWSSVNKFSFGTEDADGITTPTMSDGQTIETHSPEENKTNLYKITNASGAPTEVEVNYISGDLFYVPDMELDVYIRDEPDDYVKKTGGDEMQGPFKVLSNPDIPSSRDARRIETYGVFSGSENTALRFGTTRDRIYVGHDDTSFNGLVKIDQIAEKNAGNSVKFENDIKMGVNQIKNLGDATDDKDAVNYGQVKQDLTDLRDEFIQDLIVGTWGVDNVQSLITPGTNRMCFVKSNGQAATKFSEATIIRFFYKDDQGSDVLWDNWDPGELVSFRQIADPSVTSTFRLLTSANSNGNSRSFSVDFVKSENDTDPFGEYLERYAVTLTEFSTPVDPGALDDLYLRLDCSNDPLETQLEIKTPDFGEAALTLSGKRDNVTNATATVAFKSQNDPAETYAGYLTYRTTGSAAGYFKFNQDVDLNNKGLHSVAQIRMQPGGYIGSAANPRLTFNNSSDATDGSALLVVPRPSNNRRGFAIRGNDTSGDEKDMFYTYTNPVGTPDAVNYDGKMDSDKNLVNKEYVDNAVASIGGGTGVGLEHTPYIANMQGTKSGVNSNTPGPNEVAGFYTSSTSDGSRNEYPGNFNSLLKCGTEVVAIQDGTNSTAALVDGHDERWTGTVSVLDVNTGGLLYKNTITKVNRSGEYIYIWVREPGSEKGNKPMFAYGNISNWTNIAILIEGYRLK